MTFFELFIEFENKESLVFIVIFQWCSNSCSFSVFLLVVPMYSSSFMLNMCNGINIALLIKKTKEKGEKKSPPNRIVQMA